MSAPLFSFMISYLFLFKGWWYACQSVFRFDQIKPGFCQQLCSLMGNMFHNMNQNFKFYVSSDVKFVQWSLSTEESHSTGL